jgi:hypothetical protein
MDEESSRNWVFLSKEAHCGGPRGRASLVGTLGNGRKALGRGISLNGAQLGKLEWAFLPGTLRDGGKGSGVGTSLTMGAL